jgi:predicted dienelactone hydrolase
MRPFILLFFAWFTFASTPLLRSQEYDPLALPSGFEMRAVDLTVKDAARNRDIPLRIYLPMQIASEEKKGAPVVLFSHGLGGNREGSKYLGRHWSGRGYVAVFLQHPGSDDSVWKDEPLTKRMAAMQEAASAANYLLRVNDVPAVLDQLAKWNTDADSPLVARMDLQRVGMSGHSFGAQTTQAVSGQSVPLIGQRHTDSRVKAAIVMSPSSPRRGDPKTAFGSVKIPWMLMTGTKDTSPIGGQTVESRLAVYPGLAAGDKYELVLNNAEHSVFTDRALPGDREPRDPNHHRVILALSTAFWDAFLKSDAAAREWLNGQGPSSIMTAKDRWQQK